jgi:hypothetical protein
MTNVKEEAEKLEPLHTAGDTGEPSAGSPGS